MREKLSVLSSSWFLLTESEKRTSYYLMVMMLVAMVLETLGVGMVIPALALLTQEDFGSQYPVLKSFSSYLGDPDHGTLVIIGMLILMGAYLIKGLFLAFLVWRQSHFAYGIQERLSQKLFTVYLNKPYTFHLQRNSSQLIRNIITEVNVFSSNVVLPFLVILTEFLVVIGLVALLLFVEPVGAALVGVMIGLTAFGYYHITHSRILKWGEARQYHQGMRIQHLQQGLSGAKDIKLLGREAEFLERFRVHNTENARMAKMQSIIQSIPRLWLEVFAVFALAVLVIVLILQGKSIQIIVPTIGVFGVTAFRLLPSVNKVLTSVQAIKFGIPVVSLLEAELKNEIDQEISTQESKAIPFKNKISIKNLSFKYSVSEPMSLDDVSLEINRGESVGFIGTSGAGKSTLADIVLGVLEPTSGEIEVDSVNIHNNSRSWQNKIGYVPQTIYLTDDSLRKNIALGIPENQINEGLVQKAVKAASLDKFVSDLPEGLETNVGERGVRLSGGQLQRIGIARALYHDPEVLVLDEATSALDVPTESEVMESVRALHGVKTTIIVAHRLSTVEHCDRKYQLEKGKIINVIERDADKEVV